MKRKWSYQAKENCRGDSRGPEKLSQDFQWEKTKFRKLVSAQQRNITQVIKRMAMKPMKQYGDTWCNKSKNQVVELDVQKDFSRKEGRKNK